MAGGRLYGRLLPALGRARWWTAVRCGLPRIVGQGRALEIIMTGRKVEAEECLRIGLCEKVVPKGQARQAAEAMAEEIARFPQACVRADRHSVYLQQGLPVRAALPQQSKCHHQCEADQCFGHVVVGLLAGSNGTPRGGDGKITLPRCTRPVIAIMIAMK